MIKAVIFDFGNVLYDLNYELFFANLSALLEEDFSGGLSSELNDLIYQFDSGKISTENFIWKIQHMKNGELDPLLIINCWNSLLDKLPENRWEFLEKWSKKYPLYILSNINQLHLTSVYKHIKNVHGKLDFETRYFKAVFYSYLIKHAKPDPEIYEYVEKGLNLKGNEIIFIDDKLDNINVAQSRGWNAVLHDPTKDIVNVFDSYISKYI